MATKSCVVGATVQATGQVIQIANNTSYTKIMVEINVEANKRDATSFYGKVQIRVLDDGETFKKFDSTSIFLSYMQKECAIIKGTGKAGEDDATLYEFSLAVCEDSKNNTVDMTIEKQLPPRDMLYNLSKTTLQGKVDVKLMVDDQEFNSQQTATY